jgi:uncharacterized protein YgiM (DUF1202 family)
LHGVLAASAVAVSLLASAAMAEVTTMPAPAGSPSLPGLTENGNATPPTPAAPGSTSAAPAATPALTQPFVGTVNADRVYVRSGPGTAYYELGHVARGDLLQVVGAKGQWFAIFPPNGTFCMIAKEFVEPDSTGKSGTVKADYVNLRAGTALYKNRDPSAVLCVVRKGQKLAILGQTDKYFQVAPTERAYVYISQQFVTPAPAGTDYKIPDLKLPAGVTGPAKDTVTAPGALPSTTDSLAATPTNPTNPTTPSVNPTEPRPTVEPGPSAPEMHAETSPAMPIPQPALTFSKDAYHKFAELNDRYQAELQKPVGTRELDGLIKDYKALLEQKDSLPPSVRMGSESRIAALEKLATIQRLQKESTASADTLAQQRKALQEQYSAAEKAIEDYEKTGPYLAEGTLQTSTAVTGKYALVNPVTGRTVAYVDPASQIDIGSLLGKYIGVRGVTKKAEGTQVTVIEVKNATLLPAPVVPQPTPRK